MKKYRCIVCDWIYDPAKGDPDAGIAPGTPFEEIPEDWVCPICGVGKDQFEVVAEEAAHPERRADRASRRSDGQKRETL